MKEIYHDKNSHETSRRWRRVGGTFFFLTPDAVLIVDAHMDSVDHASWVTGYRSGLTLSSGNELGYVR